MKTGSISIRFSQFRFYLNHKTDLFNFDDKILFTKMTVNVNTIRNLTNTNTFQIVNVKNPIRRIIARVKLKFQFNTLATLFAIPVYPTTIRLSNAKSWLTTGACHRELNQIPLTKCRIYAREELRTEEIGPSLCGRMGG